MKRKIAFFDIDGTLTSEKDGSIPADAIDAIRQARQNGHLMFINTGRCFQNVEPRFREIGFDGYVCGCGTNIYCDGKDVFYRPQTHETIMRILDTARKTNVDILFESRKEVCFDTSRPLLHPKALYHYNSFLEKGYFMPDDLENPNFFSDKFVIWYETDSQLEAFRKISDPYFECIDRGGTFREFVPHGFSKATGMQFVLDYYGLSLDDTYAFGDSNNDLAMLRYAKNSIAMGNSDPVSLFNEVTYVTSKSSENGIAKALAHFKFI